VVVSVVDGEEQLAGLWHECSHLTVVPSRQDGFAVSREEDAVAFKPWYLNSKELLSGLGVPDSDIVKTARSEEL